MACVIGADVGSQSVKAVVVDDEGAVLGVASSPCAMQHPAAGWAEQEPQDWITALADAVRSATTSAGVAHGDVESIALACQVDGLVALDANLRPLRPAIIWLDRRATREASLLANAVGERELVARTGLNPDASHVAPKAMWLRDREPAVYSQARWLAPVGAYLNGWLSGEVVTDHANASSTLLYDLATRSWGESLIELAGLDPNCFPSIRPASEAIGPIRPEAAGALGLSPYCRVVVGTGDDHAAALGAGALGAGVMVDVTGTAEPVAVPTTSFVLDEKGLVETHAHAVDGMLLVENPGFVSGGSTQWLANLSGVSQADLFAYAEEAPPGCEGVLFLPALSGSMTPRWNEHMRGVFAGLSLRSDLPCLARAVLEGCAFGLRDIIDRFEELGIAGDEIRVVGGGARSRLWLQIKADATSRPVRAVSGDAATSIGSAMLAGVAAGFFRDLDEAAERCVELASEPVFPNSELSQVYSASYDAYRRLFDGVEAGFA